ncbi:MAG: hypothetical protein WAU41_07030 [Gaiellaceae bacterium]
MTKTRGKAAVGSLLLAAIFGELVALVVPHDCGPRTSWPWDAFWLPLTPALVLGAVLAAIIFRVRTQWWLLLVAIVPLFIADASAAISPCFS